MAGTLPVSPGRANPGAGHQPLGVPRLDSEGFADALLGGTNRLMGCQATITFDKEASQLQDFELLE